MDEPTPPRRPRRPKGSLTKQVILDAAADMFAERGYRNTTMQHLADKLEIAKPTLYVHAKTKEDILEGIFERIVREADARLKEIEEEPGRPDEQLRQVITYWSTLAITQQDHIRVFMADERELPGRVARYFKRWSGELADRIRDIIHDGQRRGLFDPDIDATSATFAIIGACLWGSQWFSPRGELSPDAVAQNLCRLLLHGLVPET